MTKVSEIRVDDNFPSKVDNLLNQIREANNQLSDKDVYRPVKGVAEGPLMKVVKNVLR